MSKSYKILVLIIMLSLAIKGRGENRIMLSVDPAARVQQIDGFGASDAWRTEFVGKNWPLHKKEQIADWLFSSETDENGDPRGIALSIWRFNIGAGSHEQDEESGIDNEWRRVECFLSEDGRYDFSKQAGQQWFLEAAKKRGVGRFLAFSIAPPYFMSENGLAKSSDTIRMNLRLNKYDDYAEFMARVLKYFSEHKKIEFDYLSPVNEPQWDWNTSRQEGTFATNADCFRLIRALDRQITEMDLRTKITFGEAGAIKYLYAHSDDKRRTDNQIYEFFNPRGRYYIGDLNSVYPCISGHSYWSTYPVRAMVRERKSLQDAIDGLPRPLKYWQTEYCMMEKNAETGGGWGRDLGIDMALYMARVIHYDMTVANASSWQWWMAVSKSDYKDGLVYIDDGKSNGVRDHRDPQVRTLMYDGECRTSKMLWALGNYSRFVHPGMWRVEVEDDLKANDGNLLYSAYSDGDNGLVIVIINYSKEPCSFSISCPARKFGMYLTSGRHDLAFNGMHNAENISVPARSVVTLVSKP